MDKENFKIELNKELEDLSLREIKNLINELVDRLPSSYYECIICKIKYFKGEENTIDENTLKEYNKILADFEKIQNGEICFKSYSFENGTYSYYEESVDYSYYPSNELKEVLDNTYKIIKRLVLYKEYMKVITLFESIINTSYTCEEVGNSEYDDSDEVYDSYEVDFNDIKDNLEIDLNQMCLYAIYSLLMCNKSDKFEKIWKYTKICHNIDIKGVLNVGIEKIDNFSEFYSEWLKYKNKREKSI